MRGATVAGPARALIGGVLSVNKQAACVSPSDETMHARFYAIDADALVVASRSNEGNPWSRAHMIHGRMFSAAFEDDPALFLPHLASA